MSTLRRTALFLAIVALVATAFACDNGAGDSGALAGSEGTAYLALGDSLAAGTGASNAKTTSYVGLLGEALRERLDGELEVELLAVPGATTETLIEEQLLQAIERLSTGEVRLVTVTIGGNDLNQYGAFPACQDDPADPACPLMDGLTEVEGRLDEIAGALRAADPDVVIVLQAYPNLFSGTGNQFEQQAETAFGALNERIIAVAARHEALVADPRPSFAGKGGDLTHLLDEQPDAHPNDAGYEVIADAFLRALDLRE